MKDNYIRKFHNFENDVIFIDGLWGTGKSVIAPVLCSMDGVEKQKIEHIYEYLCVLQYLGKIETDAVNALLNIHADLSQYNNLIGREVNIRWCDDSGLKNNPNSFKYIKRLFGKEGDAIVEKINTENVALTIMSHMIAQVSEPLFSAYGKRLKLIEVVRHPVYMVRHWYSYFERFYSAREFTIAVDFEGEKIPWFASNWKKRYKELSIMDRSLASIIYLYEELFSTLILLRERQQDYITVSFENFVLRPANVLADLQRYLKRNHSHKIEKILKKQKVPRQYISQGRGHTVYGWRNKNVKSERESYFLEYDFISKDASAELLIKFDELVGNYNERWPSILTKFR